MKYVNLLVSILFLVFAIVQWNDPDSLIWILVYLAISIVAFLAFTNRYYFFPYLILNSAFVIGLLFYIPDIIAWFQDGMPSITESMKASSPYIEFVREFFGLLISVVTMSFYLVISKKNRA